MGQCGHLPVFSALLYSLSILVGVCFAQVDLNSLCPAGSTGLLSVLSLPDFCTTLNASIWKRAVCSLTVVENELITGNIYFSQKDSKSQTKIEVSISGLQKKEKLHGFHVHVNTADLENDCGNAGVHFVNPEVESVHGAPSSSNRHVGDMGNFPVDSDGNAKYQLTDPVINLSGEGPFSVMGRSCVVHADEDVFTPTTNGNAGRRVACGIIQEVVNNK